MKLCAQLLEVFLGFKSRGGQFKYPSLMRA